MSAMNFNTANQTLRQLLGNGLTYHVPRFQRDYSWSENEWEDLWSDIQGILAPGGESAHYMGYLVLQSSDNRRFDIIDGQQRLTTLSLLVLAILKNLDALVKDNIDSDQNRRRIEQLRNSYLGYLDPVTLVPLPKLTLNRNNNSFYQNYLLPLERLPQRGLKASEHLLRKSFEWFAAHVREDRAAKNGADLAKIVEEVAGRLFFTVITVTDELNAFKVFETLNARGVRLSATDLLKNYLFAVAHGDGCHETEIQNLEQRWEVILGKLGSENFPDFLRVHWNSRNAFVRQADLFKTIRGHIRDKGAVFQLLRNLDEDVDVYAAFSEPTDPLWAEPEQQKHIAELRMFNVRQPYPLLLAVKRQLLPSDFTLVLRACTIISFRYNVIGGLAGSEQERTYNNVAERVARKELTSASAVIRALRTVYLSDEQFLGAFAEKQLKTTQSRNKRVARYILFKIERHVSTNDYDFDSGQYTLEHVLPENPGESWSDFSNDLVERFVYRLGNLTPLKAGANREAGNQPFEIKKALYTASEFVITRKIADENADWTPERITARQKWLAKQATSIWRIDIPS